MAYYLKCCQRCRGDLAKERDQYGEMVFCLQCGWHGDVLPAIGEEAA